MGFSEEEVRPGTIVDINVQTQGESRVGLVAVDRSVFILAENRLNLQQVFNELEKLYMEPQVELHEARRTITTRGAEETFADAGTIVLTNKEVARLLHAQAKANRIADAFPQASVRGFQIPVCAPTMSFICVDTCVQRRCVFRKLDDNDGDHYVGAAPVSVKVTQLVGGNCVLLMNPVAHHVVFVLRIIELIQRLLNPGGVQGPQGKFLCR